MKYTLMKIEFHITNGNYEIEVTMKKDRSIVKQKYPKSVIQ